MKLAVNKIIFETFPMNFIEIEIDKKIHVLDNFQEQ